MNTTLRDEREDALAVWPAFGTRITWLDTMNLIIQRSARKAVREWFDKNYPRNEDGIR